MIGPLPGPVSDLPAQLHSLPSTDAPFAMSTLLSHSADLSGPSVFSGSVVELRLETSEHGYGGGPDPALPAGPAAPTSGTSGSGAHAGGAHDGPDATLAAAILVMAVGAFALSPARRPLWTDWVALAGAHPG